MGCNGCIYEDDCEGQCQVHSEEFIMDEFEDEVYLMSEKDRLILEIIEELTKDKYNITLQYKINELREAMKIE